MWGVVCYKSVEWVGVDVRSCLLRVSQVNGFGCEELSAMSQSSEWVIGVVCYKLVERMGVDVRSCLLQVS